MTAAARTRAWSFADAAGVPLGEGEVLLWWLGQAGFLLRGAGATVLVDPYLTPGGARRFPPPFPAADAAGVDAVLVTHEHGDHLDVDVARAFAEAGSEARWVVPEPVELAVCAGAEVLVPMDWDMFEGNPGHPSHAVALAERDHPELTVLVPSKAHPVGLRRFGPGAA